MNFTRWLFAVSIACGVVVEASAGIVISATGVNADSTVISDSKEVSSGTQMVQIEHLDDYQSYMAEAQADSVGNYLLVASARTRGQASASYAYTKSIFNAGSTAVAYNLEFHVPSVQLTVSEADFGNDATYSESFYNYAIFVNSVAIFESHGGLKKTMSGATTLDAAGDKFGLAVLWSLDWVVSAGIGDFSDVLPLGLLAPGEKWNIEVTSSISTRRTVGADCADSLSDCIGGAEGVLIDPFGVSGINVVSANTSTAIPEPSTAFLQMLALLMLPVCTRRKSRSC